LDNHHLG